MHKIKPITRLSAYSALVAIQLITVAALAEADGAPGDFIEIDGRAIHYVDTHGNGTAVILEAGGGAFSTFWWQVQDAVADRAGARVISYDRAGLGWSESRTGEYSIDADARDLHDLLFALGIHDPVVLVGTSYGAFVISAFAARFPEGVHAIVLVEPNTAKFFLERPSIVAEIEKSGRKLQTKRWSLFRGLQKRGFVERLGDDPSVPAAFERFMSERHRMATSRTLMSFAGTVQAVAGVELPEVPLTLVSRGRREKHFPWRENEAEAGWRRAHADLVDSHPCADLRIAHESGHAVVLDQPEIVVDSIETIIRQSPTGCWSKPAR